MTNVRRRAAHMRRRTHLLHLHGRRLVFVLAEVVLFTQSLEVVDVVLVVNRVRGRLGLHHNLRAR